MRTCDEWAQEAMTPHGHRFSSLAQAIREARNEALEAAANLAEEARPEYQGLQIALAIRKLKNEP